jgi:hypothetical protein
MSGVKHMNAPLRLSGQSYLAFRKELADRGIVFSYSGFLNEDILSGIGNALRSKMTIDGTEEKISRAVFSAFVEQVQNVIRYSAETESHAPEVPQERDAHVVLPYGLVAVGEYPDGRHFVTCCNMIDRGDTKKLIEQLESIRGLDRKELGALMRQQLREGPPEGSKGAGVGFITIAREAHGNWEYDIVENAKDGFDFFSFEAHF